MNKTLDREKRGSIFLDEISLGKAVHENRLHFQKESMIDDIEKTYLKLARMIIVMKSYSHESINRRRDSPGHSL